MEQCKQALHLIFERRTDKQTSNINVHGPGRLNSRTTGGCYEPRLSVSHHVSSIRIYIPNTCVRGTPRHAKRSAIAHEGRQADELALPFYIIILVTELAL